MSLLRAQQIEFEKTGQLPGTTSEEKKTVLIVGGGSIGKQHTIELLNASLEEHLQVLKGFDSVNRKIEYKKNVLIPEFRGYVSRLEDSGEIHPLLGYYLVWLLDAGEIDEALPYGLWCVENGIDLPERFQSKLPTFFVGEVCKWAEVQLDEDLSADPYISLLFEAVTENDWDIVDKVSAALYRAMGFQAEQSGDLEAAAGYLETAFKMGAQVKTRLGDIKKLLAKNAAAAAEAAEADTAEAPATT
ncbi:MAG TPA: terminase [Desulfovibrio sp.]|nr:terminase [Desulfovibrio sp.]